jgi:hypothetical protein
MMTGDRKRRPALWLALFAGQPEAMQLAEDGAPRQPAAETRCEVGAGQALGMKRLEPFDRLFAPDESHLLPPLRDSRARGLGRSRGTV